MTRRPGPTWLWSGGAVTVQDAASRQMRPAPLGRRFDVDPVAPRAYAILTWSTVMFEKLVHVFRPWVRVLFPIDQW